MQVDGVAARALLDSLGETYGWTWYRWENGWYLVGRKNLGRPADMSAFLLAMKEALPYDVRRAAKLDTVLPAPTSVKERAMARALDPGGRALAVAAWPQVGAFLDEVNERLRRDGSIPYAELTPKQQEALVRLVIFSALRRQDMRVLRGDVPVFQAHPERAGLFLAMDMLTFGTREDEGDRDHVRGMGAPWPETDRGASASH